MLNPWVLLGVAILWGISIVGASTKWASLKVAEVRAEQLTRDNERLAEIGRLQEAAREVERVRVDQMNVIAENYGKGARDAEDRRRRDIAAARDGALQLRVPASICAGDPGAFGPPAPGGDGAAGVELPRTVTADLLALANDADAVADQLRACQTVILADRKE